MDAVRVAAVAALLLTAIVAPGCGRPKHEPAVLPTPPAAIARVATLRIGLPKRGNLLFNSEGPGAPHLGSASYTPGNLADSWLRVMQPVSDSTGDLAPDTLFVWIFQDPTDEEIALERGDLDVAVFWPGEVSARMRADERFRDPELGLRERGVLAFRKSAADSLNPPRADMEVLNREAFGGDLLPWTALEPDSVDGPPTRYAFDPYLPGARHLERILARIPSAGATRTLTLKYLDIPVSAFKTPMAIASPTLREVISTYRPLFVVRCAVLARPEARAAVRRIGADAFAQLAPRDAGHDQWDSVRGLYR